MIKKVTIRQIAEFCGVSKSAVARALANEPEVAPTVRREILTAARNLGYTGKQRRGPLRIAVLTSGFEYGMYRSHMECAVRQALHQAKLRCLVLNEADRELFRELSVDGVISLGVEDRLAHFWNNLQGIPLVCINDYGKYTDRIYAVSTDREASNRMMVDYLTRMGHRNIGLIRRDAHYSPRYSHARHEGFYQAMKEKHLSDRAYFESFFDPKDFPGCVKNSYCPKFCEKHL